MREKRKCRRVGSGLKVATDNPSQHHLSQDCERDLAVVPMKRILSNVKGFFTVLITLNVDVIAPLRGIRQAKGHLVLRNLGSTSRGRDGGPTSLRNASKLRCTHTQVQKQVLASRNKIPTTKIDEKLTPLTHTRATCPENS